MSVRAAIYIRYSSEEQTGGESEEYQREECKKYISEQKLSLDEDNIFIDRAKTGTTMRRRDGFNRMVALAKQMNRPFDVIICYSTSRFGRDQDEALMNKIALRKQGVDVKFVSQQIPDGHLGKIIERFYEWKDEFDSIQIGQYAFQGQKQVTQKGYHGGGPAPYGYERVRKPDPEGKTDKKGNVVEYTTFRIVPDDAEVVKRIFKLYTEGKSYKAIAHQFNTEGIRSPGGSTWAPSAVRTILFNENYTGRRIWNQTRRNKKVDRGTKVPKPREEWIIFEDAHERIVDEKTWQAVKVRADRRKEKRKHADKEDDRMARSVYLLTGLMKCEECGANFIMSTRKARGKTYRYYRCSYHANRGNDVCGNKRMVSMRRVESGVLNILSKRLQSKKMVNEVLKEIRAYTKLRGSGGEDPILKDLGKQSQEVKRQIDNLTLAIMEGGQISSLVKKLSACEELAKGLEAESKKREKNLQPVVLDREITAEDVVAAIRGLGEALEVAEPEEKRQLVQEQIKEIRIPKEGDPVLVTEPDGLSHLLVVHKNGDPDPRLSLCTALKIPFKLRRNGEEWPPS